MTTKTCHHIIRHAITPQERERARAALETARRTGDTVGTTIALASLGPCKGVQP